MSSYIYDTTRVCPKQIRFDLEDGTLHNVVFLGGGCDGNLHALPREFLINVCINIIIFNNFYFIGN